MEDLLLDPNIFKQSPHIHNIRNNIQSQIIFQTKYFKQYIWDTKQSLCHEHENYEDK